jgi:hypothetical protein
VKVLSITRVSEKTLLIVIFRLMHEASLVLGVFDDSRGIAHQAIDHCSSRCLVVTLPIPMPSTNRNESPPSVKSTEQDADE